MARGGTPVGKKQAVLVSLTRTRALSLGLLLLSRP